jgi:hypothetical protein
MNSQPIFSSNLLERVSEGMNVVDADGSRIGEVTGVHMGDPDAASVEGNEPTSVLGGSWVTNLDGLGDVPDELQSDLRRAGFLEVTGPGLKGVDRFIPGDRIADVSSETVHLHPQSHGG